MAGHRRRSADVVHETKRFRVRWMTGGYLAVRLERKLPQFVLDFVAQQQRQTAQTYRCRSLHRPDG